MTSDTPPLVRRHRVLVRLGALAQLAAIAPLGITFVTIIATLFSTGIGTLLVLGFGALLLIASLYIAWAASWIDSSTGYPPGCAPSPAAGSRRGRRSSSSSSSWR